MLLTVGLVVVLGVWLVAVVKEEAVRLIDDDIFGLSVVVVEVVVLVDVVLNVVVLVMVVVDVVEVP